MHVRSATAPAFTVPLFSAPVRHQLRPSVCSAVDRTTAKSRLLRILPSFINLQTQSDKVAQLIRELETGAPLPATSEFTSLFLEGDWRLLFSSARPVRSKGEIRVRSIVQSIRTVPTKSLINTVHWTWTSAAANVEAVLRVICTYDFVGPTRINVKLEDHQIRIPQKGDKQVLPSDLQALVVDLQRSLPLELFDPSGLVDITFIEPDFRITRFLGKRVAGVRNIFVSNSVPRTFPADRD